MSDKKHVEELNTEELKKVNEQLDDMIKNGGLRKALFSDAANKILKGKGTDKDYIDFKDELMISSVFKSNAYLGINLYDFFTKFHDFLSTFMSDSLISETGTIEQDKFYDKKNGPVLYLIKSVFDDVKLEGKEFDKDKRIDHILNDTNKALNGIFYFNDINLKDKDEKATLSGELSYNTLFYFNLTDNLKVVFTGKIKFDLNKSHTFKCTINVQEKSILNISKDDFNNIEAHLVSDVFQHKVSHEDKLVLLSNMKEMLKGERDDNGAIEMMIAKGVFNGKVDFINAIIAIKTFLYLRGKKEHYSLFEGLFNDRAKFDSFSEDFKECMHNDSAEEENGEPKEDIKIFGPESVILTGEEDALKEFMKKKDFVDGLSKHFPKRTISKLKSLSRARNMDMRDRDYVNTLFSIPFDTYSNLNLDINHFREKMNNEIYGMDAIKEHIVDQLAVFARSKSKKPNILCLSGPPGVGKTMICKIIAEAMNRKFDMISCSGMAEAFSLIGSHITYGNPQYGLILKALLKTETMNPLILLDEIDKVGSSSHNGNVQDALVTILDQDQNDKFVDRFVDIPVDLSQIQFITTVNDINVLSEPLRNRMAVIEVPGYSESEKFDILKNFIMPSVFNEYNIHEHEVNLSDDAIKQFIKDHGTEPGVRELKRTFKNFMARIVNKLESGDEKIVINDIHNINYIGSDTKNRIGFI